MSKTITNIKISDSVVEVVETNKSLAIVPNGTGALVASKTGNIRGNYAVDLQMVRGSASQVAQGLSSVIGGGQNNATAQDCCAILGGQGNTCSGFFSFIGGGKNNSASANYNAFGNGWGHGTVCGGESNNASGYYCTIGGGQNNTASAYYVAVFSSYSMYIYGHSTVCGGKNNTASGHYSFVGSGRYNTAIGSSSSVSGGSNNTAIGNYSSASGGFTNNASGPYSSVSGGLDNTASGNYSSVSGGKTNDAGGMSSIIPGGEAAKATRYGELSHAAGQFSNKGDAQHTTLVARTQTLSGNFTVTLTSPATFTKNGHGLRVGDVITLSTTGNLPTGLVASTVSSITPYTVINEGLTTNTFRVSSGGNTVSTSGTQSGTHSLTVNSSYLYLDNVSEKPTIPAETTWTFTVSLTAHNDTDNEGGWWIFRGGMKRNASNSTTIIGSVITEYGTDATISSATATVGPDISGGALYIQVGGVSQKNIRWVAIINISQVSYGTP